MRVSSTAILTTDSARSPIDVGRLPVTTIKHVTMIVPSGGQPSLAMA